jgi:hypothetical protein
MKWYLQSECGSNCYAAMKQVGGIWVIRRQCNFLYNRCNSYNVRNQFPELRNNISTSPDVIIKSLWFRSQSLVRRIKMYTPTEFKVRMTKASCVLK